MVGFIFPKVEVTFLVTFRQSSCQWLCAHGVIKSAFLAKNFYYPSKGLFANTPEQPKIIFRGLKKAESKSDFLGKFDLSTLEYWFH